jgi:hypothetical protein
MVDVVTFAFWIVSPVYPLVTNDPFGFSALIAITATPSLPVWVLDTGVGYMNHAALKLLCININFLSYVVVDCSSHTPCICGMKT